MNPRKLAEHALSILPEFYPSADVTVKMLANALIAQADLLEKYRKTHGELVDSTMRCVCELCRAYDKLMEGE